MGLSLLHEVIVSLVREQPQVLSQLGVFEPSSDDARVVEAALTQVAPVDLRADLAIVLGAPPSLALVVEVQLQKDIKKRFTWPSYAVAMGARWRCPATVVVITPDEDVARWAAAPIPFALDSGSFRPIVIGPEQIPRVTSPTDARACPELAVLSALAHGGDDDGLPVLLSMYAALAQLPDDKAPYYHDAVLGLLSATRKADLEEAMPKFNGIEFEYTSDFARKHYGEGLEKGLAEGRAEGHAEGRVEGEARMVLRLLVRLVGMVGPEVQARIRALPIEAIEALGEALLDFKAPADLDDWLAAHGG